ncbi:MAG: DUF58 domain-containing protein [bacterium]
MAKTTSDPHAQDRLLAPEAKDALKRLELVARRTVEGLLHGIHRSRRKGISPEFDHHTSYHPGDPLRHIDWRASARHERVYVKRYLEDTALTVRVVLDRSASMLQATGDASKYDAACRLAACLAYLVLKEKDAVGLVVTSGEGTHWLPARSSGRHLVAILGGLLARRPAAADSLRACLRSLLDRSERRGIVAVVSDLMFDPRPVQAELARLDAQGHEVLLFQLRDPTEEDFPFNRWVDFRDLEDAGVRHLIDTVPLKRLYREEYAALLEAWRAWARKHNAHFVSFRTTEGVERVLSEYLAFRARVR